MDAARDCVKWRDVTRRPFPGTEDLHPPHLHIHPFASPLPAPAMNESLPRPEDTCWSERVSKSLQSEGFIQRSFGHGELSLAFSSCPFSEDWVNSSPESCLLVAFPALCARGSKAVKVMLSAATSLSWREKDLTPRTRMDIKPPSAYIAANPE